MSNREVFDDWVRRNDPGIRVDWRKSGWRLNVPKYIANAWPALLASERAIVYVMAQASDNGK